MANQPLLPKKSDFPSSIHLDIIPAPQNQIPLNVVILLHGLGDTELPFSRLGQQLNLPYTACISIRGTSPVPGLITGSDAPSFHWGDDINFDSRTGDIDLDSGYEKSIEIILEQVINNVLIKKCGYKPREVILFGFGQGGMVALQVAAKIPKIELGGVVSIGGRLPASFSSASDAGKARTPVLILGGSRSTQVTRSAVDALKARFGEVEYLKWAKAEDTMPASRDEMMPIMRFFARRLKTRAGVPEGAVEIG